MHHSMIAINATPSAPSLPNQSLWRRGFALGALVLASFALSPLAHAVTPAPGGGYPGANTALGAQALQSLTTGAYNTAIGSGALFHTTTGGSNTAEGFHALFFNTTGFANIALGGYTLFGNTTGKYNTATGLNTLFANTTGSGNEGNGFQALFHNTTGNNNTGNGPNALSSNTTGSFNVANGFKALFNNTSGNFNIALGPQAGFNLNTGNNNIDIGNLGVAGESGIMRIGTNGTHTAAFIAGAAHVESDVFSGGDFKPLGTHAFGVRWVNEAGTIQAHIHRFGSVDNRLYITNAGASNLTGVYLASGATSLTSTSDERLKSDVTPVTNILEKIKSIRVVDFNMAKLSADPVTGKMQVNRNTPPRTTNDGKVIKDQIGTIAQDWMKDFPEMVTEPEGSNPYYGLNYDRIGVVALGAVKELDNIVKQKDAEIARLSAKIAVLETRDQDREARLVRLENSMGKRPKPAVRASLDLK